MSLRFAVALIALLPVVAGAVEPTRPEVLEGTVQLGAALAAAQKVCNGVDPSAGKATMRTKAIARGMSAARFDALFATHYTSTVATLDAAPARRNEACAQLRMMSARMKTDLDAAKARHPAH